MVESRKDAELEREVSFTETLRGVGLGHCLTGTENWLWVLITMPAEACSPLLLSSVLLSLNYSEQAGVKPVPGFINQRL